MKKYWERPADHEIDTGRNILRYFSEAGRLQICMPRWTNKDGIEKQGKTVALNLDALRKTPEAVELFKKIFADIIE